MRMPGFTAESSFRRGIERCYLVGTRDDSADRRRGTSSNSVQPALSIYVDGRYFCEGIIDQFGNVRCFRRGWRRVLL